MSGAFTFLDYVVFLGTLAVSMLIGIYYAFIKKQKTNADLLVGGRSMPIIPTSLSLLATYMSAILILGFAGEIYSYGSLIAEMIFGALIYIPLGGILFLPTLYGLRLTSAYEYLGMRFQSDVVRLLATGTFIIQIIMYMGVVLYAPSLALNAVIDFPVWASILLVGGCAGVYTAIGGLKAVVWTDCFQIGMMFAGMLAIIIQGSINVGGLKNAFKIADDNGRIEFLKFDLSPFTRFTSFGLFFGQGIFWISSYGTHQTTVQRYCSMESLGKAFCALICTAPLVAITMSLSVLCGIVIFANFAGCDPVTLGLIKKSDQIAPYFVLVHLAETSGLMGLFIACLYSGALSTVSSGLNSLAAVTWQDFCSRITFFKEMDDNQQGLVTKIIGLIYGAISIGMGFLAGQLGGVLNAAIVVNGAVAGPLLGVFILGVLIPFSNKIGATVGMLVAHFITLGIGIGGLIIKVKHPTLPFRIDECSNSTIEKVQNFTQVLLMHEQSMMANSTIPVVIDWPQKIFTVSNLLYPLIGTSITVIIGSLLSLCTGPTKLTEEQYQYTHPFIVYLHKRMRGKSSKRPMGRNGYNVQNVSSQNKRQNGKKPTVTTKVIPGVGQLSHSEAYFGGNTSMPNHYGNGVPPPRNQTNFKGSYDNRGFHQDQG